tara:strand:- start:94 stop:858 length:765 start_codon:yes stop_codon:yes gene_type:complete
MFTNLLINDPLILLIVIIIGFIAGIVKGIIGFALPMILITGLSVFIPIEQALASLILPTIITNFIQSFTISKSSFFNTIINYKIFLFFSSIFLILSSQFYLLFSAESIMGFIGIILFAYTFSQILGFQLKFTNNDFLTVIIGSINGVLGGISGIWGPLTVSYLMSLKIEKNEQIKVQGIMYSLGSILLLIGHLYSGIFNKYTFSLSIALVPLCIAGLFIGSIIRNKIEQNTFKNFTLIMILIASINLIKKAFLD